MSEFAKYTTVPPEKSKAEIERTLSKYGATSFASGWVGSAATIIFEAKSRRIRFTLPLASQNDQKYRYKTKEQIERLNRQKWRCMLLAIKAKLEVVESGISTFEEEFMAHIVLPNGNTVGKEILPQVEKNYSGSAMPLMLGAG